MGYPLLILSKSLLFEPVCTAILLNFVHYLRLSHQVLIRTSSQVHLNLEIKHGIDMPKDMRQGYAINHSFIILTSF